jgi:hypothetical protein
VCGGWGGGNSEDAKRLGTFEFNVMDPDPDGSALILSAGSGPDEQK